MQNAGERDTVKDWEPLRLLLARQLCPLTFRVPAVSGGLSPCSRRGCASTWRPLQDGMAELLSDDDSPGQRHALQAVQCTLRSACQGFLTCTLKRHQCLLGRNTFREAWTCWAHAG